MMLDGQFFFQQPYFDLEGIINRFYRGGDFLKSLLSSLNSWGGGSGDFGEHAIMSNKIYKFGQNKLLIKAQQYCLSNPSMNKYKFNKSMRMVLRVVRGLETQKPKPIKTSKISIQDLINQFNENFTERNALYQSPLDMSKNLLSYTARLAQTVVNLQKVTPEQKKTYFKKIKKSILNNQLTPKSSVQLCEAMINFPFEGDEQPVLQKIRDYLGQHSVELTPNQTDRFNKAYKYLMVEKARGPVKFVDFQLKNPASEQSELREKLKNLFSRYKINQYSLSDWIVKREIRFEMKIADAKMNIILKGVKKDCQIVEKQILVNKLLSLAEKGCLILIPGLCRKQSQITSRQLAKQLLLPEPLFKQTLQIKVDEHQQNIASNILRIINRVGSEACQNVYAIDIPLMQRVNHILLHCSESGLRRAFGYLQLNLFHIQYKNLLHTLNFQKKAFVAHLTPIDLNKELQTRQLSAFTFFLPQQLQAQAILQFIKTKKAKSIQIVVDQKQVSQYLQRLLRFVGDRPSEDVIEEENKSLGTLKNKLALICAMYQISMQLPIIEQSVRSLRKGMYPFTAQYRQ